MATAFLAGSGGSASAADGARQAASVHPAAYTDCKDGWVCFWDYPGFAGGAWSEVNGKGAYGIPAPLAGKVSSVLNNSPYTITLNSNGDCSPSLSLKPGRWYEDLSLENCGGTVYDTWNNRVTGVDIG
ncbi:peptidase inhibitor family I36 protein [Actinacidiphila yanglinensis]|nr:peptidase inhibitor family I36 protein [Actinacidiphila yanglinensis]